MDIPWIDAFLRRGQRRVSVIPISIRLRRVPTLSGATLSALQTARLMISRVLKMVLRSIAWHLSKLLRMLGIIDHKCAGVD